MTPRKLFLNRLLCLVLFVVLTLAQYLVIDMIAVAIGSPEPGRGSLMIGLLVYLVPAALAYFVAQSLTDRLLRRQR